MVYYGLMNLFNQSISLSRFSVVLRLVQSPLPAIACVCSYHHPSAPPHRFHPLLDSLSRFEAWWGVVCACLEGTRPRWEVSNGSLSFPPLSSFPPSCDCLVHKLPWNVWDAYYCAYEKFNLSSKFSGLRNYYKSKRGWIQVIFNKGRSLVAMATVRWTGKVLIRPTWIQVNPWLNTFSILYERFYRSLRPFRQTTHAPTLTLTHTSNFTPNL